MRDGRAANGRVLRSLRLQGVALLAVLLALPALLYSIFARDDAEQRELLITAVHDAGTAIAAGLAPMLRTLEPDDFGTLESQLARFADPRRNVIVLFHPKGSDVAAQFFFVAGVPAVAAGQLAAERDRLAELGILPALARFCAGEAPLTGRIAATGSAAVITSITGVDGAAGCWAIVVAVNSEQVRAGIDDRPFWSRRPVQLATLVYVAMAALILLIFASVRANLRRYRRLALAPMPDGSFLRATDVPEMAPIAHAIDTMVQRLRMTAENLRQAAEANAHALKGPIATIRQAVEPLAGTVPTPEQLQIAFAVVSVSLDRLDGLVASARRLDTTTADLLEIAEAPINLSELLAELIADCRAMYAAQDITITDALAPRVMVRGEAEAIESSIENLLDNAVSFSPLGCTVHVTLSVADGRACVCVEDEGPGVPEAMLTRIFDRYYSDRRASPRSGSGGSHFGIGLWIVRQNVQALGGEISVRNRSPRGFLVALQLPLVA